MRVLIVDDHSSMRSVLRKMLHQMRCFETIEEAGDGEEAWEKLQCQPYDLVICDTDMPKLDGVELLKRCGSVPALKELPFLMISADALPETVAHASEWGAADYLVKPFSFQALRTHIEELFDRWRTPEESLFRQVEKLRETGRAKDALRKIGQIEEATGSLKPRWLNLRAECLMALGELEAASQTLEKIFETADSLIAAHKNYAEVQLKLGNTAKGIDALAKADSLSPMEAERKIHLGGLLMQSGREEDGSKHLQAILKEFPQKVREASRMKIAELYLESGRFEDAEKLYVRVLKANPMESIETYNRLAIALRRQGKFADAEKYYAMALKIYPDNAPIYHNIGVLQMNRQQYAQAAENFRKALQLDPEFADARKMLKTALEKLPKPA
ncbi:MAG: response regulator [Desulfobacteraceae bacterium]|nr:response regulator [Desulfobacteraceae bacterium]